MKDDLKRDIKGKVDNIKGRVKEAFGALSGNKEQEGEGMVERAKGAAEQKIADVERKIGSHGSTERSDRSPKSGPEEADDE